MLSPRGARGVQKAELNGNVDSDNNHGGSSRTYVLHRTYCDDDGQHHQTPIVAAGYGCGRGRSLSSYFSAGMSLAECGLTQPARGLVPRSGRGAGEDRRVAAGLQREASAQQLAVPNPSGVCRASRELLQSWTGARGLKRRPLAPDPHPRYAAGRTKIDPKPKN